MSNILALCGARDRPELKVVAIQEQLQSEVTDMFLEQERDFYRDCVTREFNQDWKLESNEIAELPVPDSIDVFQRITSSLPTNMDPLEGEDIVQNEVRALAMLATTYNPNRILVQRFDKSQVLQPGRFLFLERGVFSRIDSASLRIGDNLTCIVEDQTIKFKNPNNLTRFMDISGIMREASEEEAREFIENSLFHVSDSAQFLDRTNRLTRRRMRSIKDRNLLNGQDANELKTLAEEAGVVIEVQNDKIVMPTRTAEITKIVHFLCDGRYLGPMSKKPMLANSYRPAND